MKIGILFGGQGSQSVGMGKDLYDHTEEGKRAFDAYHGALDLKKLCFEGPMEELSQTAVTQPALIAFSIAVVDALQAAGVQADMTAGLSIGEYAALYAAGVLSREDVLAIAGFRGKAMQEAVDIDAAMVAVMGLDPESIDAICKRVSDDTDKVEITNLNCPGQTVISGEARVTQAAAEECKKAGAKRCIPLQVSGPFHTSYMEGVSDLLEEKFKQFDFHEMSIPVVFNLTGDVLPADKTVQEMMTQQVKHGVQFEKIVRTMLDQGVDCMIEVGHGNVIAGFLKRIDKRVPVLPAYDVETIEAAVAKIKGE